ncbi:MAG: hypothetical protein L3J59_08210 [Methylococcaceae bacterium]|nr:hypothetical protein [Methylococcaceae bacterium]
MITNTTSNAANLITNAQYKASTAAQEIAKLPVAKNEVGSIEFNSSNLIKPVLSLKEAEFETSAAAKLLETEKVVQSSLFDAMA